MPRREIFYSQLTVLAALAMTGCHAIPDPSCAIQDELADERCRDLFYHPDCSVTGLTDEPWYRCPPGWAPECPPVFRCAIPPRHLPAASQVLALPATRRIEPTERPPETPSTAPEPDVRQVPPTDDI